MSVARHWLSTLLLSAALAVSLAAHADPRYSVTALAGANSFSAGINNAGAVVGNYAIGFDISHAFVNTGGGALDLGTLGGVSSRAVQINDSGQIVGSAQTSAGLNHAFLYSGGAMADLGTIGPAGSRSAANGINNGGTIIGSSAVPFTGQDIGPRAFLRPPGGPLQDIGTLPFPNPYAEALDINNLGQVVGMSGVFGPGDPPSHAFLYSHGTMTDLGSLGADPSSANAINDLGQVVGFASLPGLHIEHPFLYSNGAMFDLDPTREGFGSANDINNRGQVVGSSSFVRGAFLWEGAGMQSLTAMIDPASGWRINVATGINEFGQIAATAVKDGQFFAVRLDPVPEPATLGMLLAGLGLVGTLGRRSRTCATGVRVNT
jgi:probable HAF family extracellular repeat protein